MIPRKRHGELAITGTLKVEGYASQWGAAVSARFRGMRQLLISISEMKISLLTISQVHPDNSRRNRTSRKSALCIFFLYALVIVIKEGFRMRKAVKGVLRCRFFLRSGR
jgi:hypothetical protein